MTRSHLMRIAMRTTTLGAFLAGFATVALAQQKTKPVSVPPVTTKGAIKSSPSADKGQATAESKRTDAAADKTARAADKVEDKAERMALKEAKTEPEHVLKGIKLTGAEKKAVNTIEKKFSAEIKDAEKAEDAAEKAGHPDATFASKIDAIRLEERTALRDALTTKEQVKFDKNVAALGTKKP